MPPRVITQINEFETWESAIDGVIWVRKFDRHGDVIEEQVKPHGKLVIAPEERRFNQERAVAADMDPFLNGMLVPVKLVESADDYDELTGNPNHLTEQDMRAMFANPKQVKKLEEDLSKISNPTTLQRMIALAEDEEVDATIRQINVVRDRLAELVTEPAYQEVEVISGPDGNAFASSAAPSPAPRKRRGRR